MELVVRNAVLRGQQGTVDIVIDKDRIVLVQPKAAGKGVKEIDAAGSLVLPGLFNVHLHADLMVKYMDLTSPVTVKDTCTNEFLT